jgi:hypothetical protein
MPDRRLAVNRSIDGRGLIPWLYFKGISAGDFFEALSVVLGEDSPNLSPSVVVVSVGVLFAVLGFTAPNAVGPVERCPDADPLSNRLGRHARGDCRHFLSRCHSGGSYNAAIRPGSDGARL